MNSSSILKMFISDEAHWFKLENVNMIQDIFNQIIAEIKRVSNDLYKKTGAEQFIMMCKNGEIKIHEIKVPNVVKALVQNTSHDIKIYLTGILPNKEFFTDLIQKPLDMNRVLRLIPAYHGIKLNQDQQKVSKKR